ncbi:Ig-like domain-containing protein, partial [Patescibacteria group bacterium]
LDSIKEGEIISSLVPEFFGEGPPGTEIDITLESDPISTSVSIDELGTWNWSPDESLETGSHTISVTWLDAEGVVQSITKNFIVQASEVPVYEATPSALPTPDVATPTATPDVTPIATSAATPPPQPKSGIAKPTLILYIMGMGLLVISGAIVYFAFEER